MEEGPSLPEVTLFSPRRFSDERGWFTETYNQAREASNGILDVFVQDNQSFSSRAGTIRGIHFQNPPKPQAKLVRCTRGSVIDYVVDLRRGSPTYGRHVSAKLTAENGEQLYVPVGFGHGFVTLEDCTEISYKVSALYSGELDAGVRWDSEEIGIAWPLGGTEPTLSMKDRGLPLLREFESPFGYSGSPLQLKTVS